MEREEVRAKVFDILDDKFNVYTFSDALDEYEAESFAALDLDSLDFVDLVSFCEREFGIEISDEDTMLNKHTLVKDFINMITFKVNQK